MGALVGVNVGALVGDWVGGVVTCAETDDTVR